MAELRVQVTGSISSVDPLWLQIAALCCEAYEEDLAPTLSSLRPVGHVLGWRDDQLVSHACWVTRQLQPAGVGPLRTAYIELVATALAAQRCGFATALLRQTAIAIRDFELAALSPFDVAFYQRLGWQRWRGPLAIRTPSGAQPTPDEQIMILPLARSPSLDLDAPLTAEWREGELW